MKSTDQEIQTTYIRIVTLRSILKLSKASSIGCALTHEFYEDMATQGVKEGAAKQRLRAVHDEGHIKRILRGAYQVSATGIQILEAIGEGPNDN